MLLFRNLGNPIHPTLPVSFGRDTKSRWFLLSGVYDRGSKRSHTGGKHVTNSNIAPIVCRVVTELAATKLAQIMEQKATSTSRRIPELYKMHRYCYHY